MSRIADKPTVIPEGVEVKVENNTITVKGKNGELKLDFLPKVEIAINGNELMVNESSNVRTRQADEKKNTALRGTYTSLIRNMIKGVTEGFEKNLEIVGTGYRAQMQGTTLVLSLGYSHQIEYVAPEGITLEVGGTTRVKVKGSDKYLVGEVAAKIRGFRKPNVYSGKGVKYANEVIIRKEGKKV